VRQLSGDWFTMQGDPLTSLASDWAKGQPDPYDFSKECAVARK
jgi:hypothetical protein